jgi:hypothetical protein
MQTDVVNFGVHSQLTFRFRAQTSFFTFICFSLKRLFVVHQESNGMRICSTQHTTSPNDSLVTFKPRIGSARIYPGAMAAIQAQASAPAAAGARAASCSGGGGGGGGGGGWRTSTRHDVVCSLGHIPVGGMRRTYIYVIDVL